MNPIVSWGIILALARVFFLVVKGVNHLLDGHEQRGEQHGR